MFYIFCIIIGVVRKVKVSYLKTGHSHDDCDAIIGNVVSHIRGIDIADWTTFQKVCAEAINKDGSTILSVNRLISIPDYASIFSDFNNNNIEGLSQISLCRITAKANGEGVNMYYKDDSTADGWFPRPIIAANKSDWDNLFLPDDVSQGIPIEVVSNPLMDRGQRQSWQYNVVFEGGEKKQFVIPCTPLPVNLNRATVIERLSIVPHQIPLGSGLIRSMMFLKISKRYYHID